METQIIHYFLNAYLSVEEDADIINAVKVFARKEGNPSVASLRDSLRTLLSAGTSEEQIRQLFRIEGSFQIEQDSAKAQKILLDLFAHLGVVMSSSTGDKPYDVFISHSSQDKQVANRLAKDLQERGYVAWLDSWEILVGHNIVDEVYRGITESEFVVVMLSQASCDSNWVQQEFTAALISEIESREVTVLPVKIDDCEIPAALRTKRYANFVSDWESGLRELSSAIDTHRASRSVSRPGDQISSINTFRNFDEWCKLVDSEIPAIGSDQGLAFKDVYVGPPDSSAISLAKQSLLPLIDSSRVDLRGYGGPLFPYDKYPSTNEIRLPDGIRFVDEQAWPYRSKSFHFWQFDTSLRFVERENIDEDFALNEANEHFMRGRMARSGVLLDIVRPLLFARNILTHEKRTGTLAVRYDWIGLENRTLLELSHRRMGFLNTYTCQVDRWTKQIEVTLQTDLAFEARRAVLDVFWLFGWEPQGEALALVSRDIETMISGLMPN